MKEKLNHMVTLRGELEELYFDYTDLKKSVKHKKYLEDLLAYRFANLVNMLMNQFFKAFNTKSFYHLIEKASKKGIVDNEITFIKMMELKNKILSTDNLKKFNSYLEDVKEFVPYLIQISYKSEKYFKAA